MASCTSGLMASRARLHMTTLPKSQPAACERCAAYWQPNQTLLAGQAHHLGFRYGDEHSGIRQLEARWTEPGEQSTAACTASSVRAGPYPHESEGPQTPPKMLSDIYLPAATAPAQK